MVAVFFSLAGKQLFGNNPYVVSCVCNTSNNFIQSSAKHTRSARTKAFFLALKTILTNISSVNKCAATSVRKKITCIKFKL